METQKPFSRLRNVILVTFAFLLGISLTVLYYGVTTHKHTENIMYDVDSMQTEIDSLRTGSECACDEERYNVEHKTFSGNYPIATASEAKEMVRRAWESDAEKCRGFWISKLTLDLIFCHDSKLNGIFVYEAFKDKEKKQPTFVIEGYQSSAINTMDDGTSIIYYSDKMCPTDCGACGN